jgi:signal transduction histidine kinase
MEIMEERAIEPGLLRIFRYYCGFSIGYFYGNFLYTGLTTHLWTSATSLLFLINAFIFIILWVYLSIGWLESKLKGLYLPIAILTAALGPIYTSIMLWPLQAQDPVTNIIYRSWMLFPILIVPIVLVAWQYSILVTIVLVAITSFYDMPFIIMSVGKIDQEAIPFIGVPILRSIAMGTVGTIVNLLMKTQRTQRQKLIEANEKLSEHAQTLEQLAVSRERNRLARELHDTLAHTLSSQILTLEALRLSVDPDDKELTEPLDQLIQNTRNGLTDTRRALKDLRAGKLEDLGLATALKSLVADAAARANCSATCTISENLPPLSTKAEQCMYRIAQEALENIVLHANAGNMELKLVHRKGNVILEISDDGQGFNYLQSIIMAEWVSKGWKNVRPKPEALLE